MDDREGDPADTEPSLGWTEQEARWGRYTLPADVDTELDCCDEEESDAGKENGDREPSLGSTNPSISGSQQTWGAGGSDDAEGDEHDGRERAVNWTDEEAARGRYPSIMVHEVRS